MIGTPPLSGQSVNTFVYISATPDTRSLGSSKPKTISESPSANVDLKNPTPNVFPNPSNTLTVTRTGVFDSAVKLVLKYAKSPASYFSTSFPFSLVVFTSVTVNSGTGAIIDMFLLLNSS